MKNFREIILLIHDPSTTKPRALNTRLYYPDTSARLGENDYVCVKPRLIHQTPRKKPETRLHTKGLEAEQGSRPSVTQTGQRLEITESSNKQSQSVLY
ncbi:hypothetical protein TNCV_2003881 [Trichonephila clavipes]|nr:hypothetical protein TNCV_2003881 [Trichonephila clavipes]